VAGFTGSSGRTGTVSVTSHSDIQGSIRGRVGVAWDRALLYATGGVAFAGIDNSITDISGFFVPAGTSASFSNTRVGWTVGGGIERHQQLVGTGGIPLFEFWQYHELSIHRHHPCPWRGRAHETSAERKPGSGRLQLQIRHLGSLSGRCKILSQGVTKNPAVRPGFSYFHGRNYTCRPRSRIMMRSRCAESPYLRIAMPIATPLPRNRMIQRHVRRHKVLFTIRHAAISNRLAERDLRPVGPKRINGK
jgi:hypothetical protein